MQKNSTRLFKLLLCTLGLGLGANSAQAAFAPVVVTGFNQDVVANGSGTTGSSTTYDVDGALGTGYCFMAPNFVNPAGLSPTSFLPANGLISSAATSGLTFQMASYTGNNSLRLPLTGSGTTGTGVLALATPQAAGEVYALVTSGGGISTVTVTVTFTDGTTQVLAAQTVADWYGGTNPAMLGLGRVSRDAASTIDNNINDPRLYQIRVPLLAANYTKQIQSVGFNKTSTTGVLNVFGITLNSVCSGAPTGGTAVSTVTSVCASTGITLSLTGATGDVGITYQWQSSTDNGVTWADIAGATSITYATSGLTATTLYRARVSCGTLSANSAPVTVTAATATYATLPFTESFENTWINGCNTRDVPTAFWRNTPATGNNSWRRDDDGAIAVWTSPATGAYAPISSQGLHSARFHSYYAASNSIGTFDLLVNLSTAGAKRLSFDYVNTSGTDSLTVQISEDGGATFTRLAGYILSSTFATKVVGINSVSPTAILRFRARSDFGNTDIGVDNIVLESATGCLTPANLSATTTTTTASLSWLVGGTGTYTVLYGPTGFDPTLASSTTNVYTTVTSITAPPYAITGLAPGTTYQFYVRLNCAGSTTSGTAGPVSFTTQIVNDDPCGATVLTINNTCTPIATTTFGAGTTASTVYGTGGQGAGCGSITAPHDVWFSFTTAATGPTSTQVRISVTGGAASVVRAYSGTACAGPLTYINCVGTASNTAAPTLDLTALTPSTTYYVRVNEYSTTGTLGNFTICASPVPNCPAPASLAAGSLTNTTATLTWTATSGGTGSTYSVIYGPTGFLPASGGTTIGNLPGTTVTITGLSAATGYCFYVQQICGGFNGSSTLTGPMCFTTPLTPPTNDEPCGAITLTSGTAITNSNVGATTTIQPGINTPACSPAQVPNDVWFAITPTGNSLTINLTGNAAGMVRLFTSPSCSVGPFTPVFCRGSNANNTAVGSVSIPNLTPGTRYYIAVSNYGGTDPSGIFTLTATSVLANKLQIESNALQVFPNPSNTGQLTLRLNGSFGAGQATLLNALGQKVLTRTLSAGTAEQTLTTRGLAAGLYTLRVQVGSEVLTRKVVLE